MKLLRTWRRGDRFLILAAFAVSLLWVLAFRLPHLFWAIVLPTSLLMLLFGFVYGGLAVIRPTFRDLVVGVFVGVVMGILTRVGMGFPFFAPLLEDTVKPLLEFRYHFPAVIFVAFCEEVFWRGTLQRWAMFSWGKLQGFLSVVFLYAFLHLVCAGWTLSLIALLLGAIWGFMFVLFKDLTPSLVSHTVWDILLLIGLKAVV